MTFIRIRQTSACLGTMGLTAAVITWNEERNIERCLRGLVFADEIVVLDSLSTDRTVEIAQGFTDKVIPRAFIGFSEQKSAALEMATQDWVLFVDADEVVSEKLAIAIQDAMADGRYDSYRIPRLTSFLGREMRHCGWYPDYQLRLAKRAKARFPERLVHETMVVDGTVGTLKVDLIHESYPNMEEYARKMVLYARAAALQKQNDGCVFRLTDLLFKPGLAFAKMYAAKQGYRDGLHGFVLSALTACSTALRYAMLWEMEARKGKIGSKPE